MQVSFYDYLKDHQILGVGQYSGGGGADDLSLSAYRTATGANAGAGDAGYRAWVEANPGAQAFKRGLADPSLAYAGNNMALVGPDGQVNIPDKILASNMMGPQFLGFDRDGMMDYVKFFAASLGGAAAGGALSGAAGAGVGTGAGAGAFAAGDTAMAAGALGGAAGPSFGGLTAAQAAGVAGTGGAAGGWDYGEFLNSIGIDPASTQFSGGTLSNAEIMSQIGSSGMTPDMMTRAKDLLSKGNSAKSVADMFGISEGAVNLIGKLAATGLGIYGANQQQESQQRLADRFAEYGAPYRARLAESYADPAAFLKNSPDINAAVDQGTNATARALSVQGNPAGSGHALTEIQDYATKGLYGRLGQERDRLAGFGGLTAYNAAAPGAATNAVNAEAGVPNAIGAGINSITAPIKTTYQTMMDFFNQPGVA